MLALSSDGPNVNKTVYNLLQAHLKKLQYRPLFNLTSCLLHTAHNAFLKGLQSLSLDISDFIIKIYYFFHNFHLRCTNFEKIQSDLNVPKHAFIKHVSTRWLTIGPAAERILEQLPALENYFLKYIPKNEKDTEKKQKYLDIVKYLKTNCLKSCLEFVVFTAKIFTTEFTLKLQLKEPLIHILYSQLKKLLYLLCSNILKPSSHQEKAKNSLSAIPKIDQLQFLNSVKQFYVSVIDYLFKKIKNLRNLKNFECLNPKHIKNSDSI